MVQTGRGIAPDFLPHVFERFRQEEGSPNRGTSGLGLGLSIAKHLVELHGGTIEAGSAGADRGSTFLVRVPCMPSGGHTGERTAQRARGSLSASA